MSDDAALASAIAAEAWALLSDLRNASGLSGRALGDEGDRAANRLILDRLRAARPDDAILSEEAADDLSRLSAARVWVVDPLDGTREYAAGRDDWAVHVGLSIDGVAAVGAVACDDRVWATTPAPVLPAAAPPLLFVSRSRAPDVAAAVADTIGLQLAPMGSAGAKAMAVVRGDGVAYLHAGGQHQWDNCAPVAVAVAAGLHCSRIDGAPLRYNLPDTLVPDLLICRPDLAGPILAAVRAFG